MQKNSGVRRRSSSNPVRLPSSQDDPRNSMRGDPSRKTNQESMIPKPRKRSYSSDRLSGMRKSHMRPTTGEKTSIGQYTTASSMISPMVGGRYTLGEKSTRPSLIDQGRGRSSYDQPMSNAATKGLLTPKSNDNRNVRVSSAERAMSLAPKGNKKEIRPLNDKNYQNLLQQKTDRYFHSIKQSNILNNNGSIKPLTLKIFIDTTNLLLKLLDVKCLLNNANYIEEIPKIAKKLHYPGSVNKSWLKTANTPHAWPQAIGWLGWLVELCEAKDVASEIFTVDKLPIIADTEKEATDQRNILSAVLKSYAAFNDEKPEEEKRIFEQFFIDEAEKRGLTQEKLDEAKAEAEKAREIYEKEFAKSVEINAKTVELQQQLANLKKDRIKQKEHIIEQRNKLDKMKKEINYYDDESNMLKQKIEKLKVTKDELSKTIKDQPMSVAERDEILKSCMVEETFLQNFDSHLEELKKEAYTLDMRLTTSKTNLDKIILNYNKSLITHFTDRKINIDNFLMPENGVCEADFLDKLKEKKVMMTDFLEEQYKELMKNKDLLESYGKKKEALQCKKDTMIKEIEQEEAIDEKKKQDFKAKEIKKREEIKNWQIKLDQVNEAVEKVTEELRLVEEELINVNDEKENCAKQELHIKENIVPFVDEVIKVLVKNQTGYFEILQSFLDKM